MKRYAIVLSLMGAVCVAPAHAGTAMASARRQIQPILDQMAIAANAHDTDRFMAAYLRRPTLVFVINGEVIHGWDALHEQQLKWWRNGKSDAVYTQTGPTEFEQIGSGMVVTTRTLDSRRTLPDGRKSTGSFAVTDIWQKLPQGWRIVYSHESWVR
ncbi:MAG TPA: nuclear transport factor 2 family protein [Gammaproteobacteria bacterium]|nr:nuclear transport factor 2 family protein [Gammaproteobacteria bacterium]